MKKTLLTFFCIMSSLLAGAQSMDFKDDVLISIPGLDSDPIEMTTSITLNEDGTGELLLHNLFMFDGTQNVPVGNVLISGIPVEMTEDQVSFSYEGTLTFLPGDMEGIEEWQGPAFGSLPVKLSGVATMESLCYQMTIDATQILGVAVEISFGDNGAGVKYRDDLVVTINDISTAPQKTTVYLSDNGDGTINFLLPNFVLNDGENDMGVGNIEIKNIPVTKDEETGIISFTYENNLLITEGDKPGVDLWIGPILEEIPLKLVGQATAERLHVTIDIDMMENLGQVIYVEFGHSLNQIPYTDDLVVTIDGESIEPQKTTVYLAANEGGTYDFILNNFVLVSDDDEIGVGNIVIKDLIPNHGEADSDVFTLKFDGDLLITEGNKPGVDMWIGPMLEEIPLKLVAKVSEEKMYVTIDIDMMDSLGQVIYVTFGHDFNGKDDDAIHGIAAGKDAEQQIYTLSGIRVQKATRGLYIINGKKVVK